MTTDTLFARKRLPRSIGVVGAGAVGLEMAVALSRLGVRVVAADLKSAPGGIVDPVIAERAIRRFREEFTLWLGRPVQVDPGPSGAEVRSGDEAELVEVVLAALGREPKSGRSRPCSNWSDSPKQRPVLGRSRHAATAGNFRIPGR